MLSDDLSPRSVQLPAGQGASLKKSAKLRTQCEKKVRRRLCAEWRLGTGFLAVTARMYLCSANASLTALEPLALCQSSAVPRRSDKRVQMRPVKLHLGRLKTFMPPKRLSDAGRSGHPCDRASPKLRPSPARFSLALLARLMTRTSECVRTSRLGNACCIAMMAVDA